MNILQLFCKSFLLIVCLIFDTVQAIEWHPSHIGTGIITLSSASYTVTYNISSTTCTGVNIGGPATKIRADGNCINIYEADDCSGHFIRYLPDNTGILWSPNRYTWVNHTLRKRPLYVHSIGPCFDQCDPRNWEGAVTSDEEPLVVTFYDKEHFKGRETIVEISSDSDDCHILPDLPLFGWMSIKVPGEENATCVELHSERDCGGRFIQVRPGYPISDLHFWGLSKEDPAKYVVALSRCGAFCKPYLPPGWIVFVITVCGLFGLVLFGAVWCWCMKKRKVNREGFNVAFQSEL